MIEKRERKQINHSVLFGFRIGTINNANKREDHRTEDNKKTGIFFSLRNAYFNKLKKLKYYVINDIIKLIFLRHTNFSHEFFLQHKKVQYM